MTAFLYVSVDHAFVNAAIGTSSRGLVAGVSSFFQSVLWALPMAALALAWRFDGKRQETDAEPEFALALERTTSPALSGTFTAALSHPSVTLAWVDTLVRMRRAHAHGARDGSPSADVDSLRALIVGLRQRIDSAVTEGSPVTRTPDFSSRSVAHHLSPAHRRSVARPDHAPAALVRYRCLSCDRLGTDSPRNRAYVDGHSTPPGGVLGVDSETCN
jgi:hypothetical protein